MSSIKQGMGFVLVIAIAACVFVAANWNGNAADKSAANESAAVQTTSELRIGVFDSRAVAVAHTRSESFAQYLKGLRAELEEAKAAGNEKRVQELEAFGPAMQELIHKQGFGIWPIDNILEKIEDQLPELAKEAKVDMIVSKWDIVYQGPGIEFVDVNEFMVKPFNPDEQTMKIIKELLTQKPIPIEELLANPDK